LGDYYVHQGSNVITSVCASVLVFVCLSLVGITRKVCRGFSRNHVGLWTTRLNLGTDLIQKGRMASVLKISFPIKHTAYYLFLSTFARWRLRIVYERHALRRRHSRSNVGENKWQEI